MDFEDREGNELLDVRSIGEIVFNMLTGEEFSAGIAVVPVA